VIKIGYSKGELGKAVWMFVSLVCLSVPFYLSSGLYFLNISQMESLLLNPETYRMLKNNIYKCKKYLAVFLRMNVIASVVYSTLIYYYMFVQRKVEDPSAIVIYATIMISLIQFQSHNFMLTFNETLNSLDNITSRSKLLLKVRFLGMDISDCVLIGNGVETFFIILTSTFCWVGNGCYYYGGLKARFLCACDNCQPYANGVCMCEASLGDTCINFK